MQKCGSFETWIDSNMLMMKHGLIRICLWLKHLHVNIFIIFG